MEVRKRLKESDLAVVPEEELRARHARLRNGMARLAPDAGGLLLLGDVNILYASGTLAAGLVWLPREGEPLLLVRRAQDRAAWESSLPLASYRSYGDVPGLCAGAGVPLPADAPVLVDMGWTTWSAGQLLQARLKGVTLASGDTVVRLARMTKTPWEIARMAEAGRRQAACLRELGGWLRPGMREGAVFQKLESLYHEAGHDGLVRIAPPGRAVPGCVSAGASALLTTAFDGPLGTVGGTPAMPFGGNAAAIWKSGEILAVDVPFAWQGYVADRTQCFWDATVPVPDALRRAHDCCRAVETALVARLRPGVTPSSLWEEASAIAASHGFSGGFMGCGPDQARFVGHGIGLEMDELPAIAREFDIPLEEGAVIALEPKIALPPYGMIGLEHTFAVTPSGGRALNAGTDGDSPGAAPFPAMML